MKRVTKQIAAVAGACALFAAVCGMTSAQTPPPMHHTVVMPSGRVMHHPMRHIMRQKAHYMRAVAHGNYAAAERAHLKAKAIRHAVRTQNGM